MKDEETVMVAFYGFLLFWFFCVVYFGRFFIPIYFCYISVFFFFFTFCKGFFGVFMCVREEG